MGVAGSKEEQKEKITKRHWKTFWGHGYIHYFDCGDGFLSLYIGKSHQIIVFKYMQFTVFQLNLSKFWTKINFLICDHISLQFYFNERTCCAITAKLVTFLGFNFLNFKEELPFTMIFKKSLPSSLMYDIYNHIQENRGNPKLWYLINFLKLGKFSGIRWGRSIIIWHADGPWLLYD